MDQQKIPIRPDSYEQVQVPEQLQQIPQSKDLQDAELLQGRWSPEQHVLFLRGIIKLGKDWKELQKCIRTRNSAQVRSHAQKYFIKLLKIQKERKKNKNKLSAEPTELQSEIMSMFTEDDFCQKTPQEIINVLRRQLGGKLKKKQQSGQDQKKNLKSLANKLDNPQHLAQKSQEHCPKNQNKNNSGYGAKREDSIYPILEMYEEQQDESYLLKIMKNHKFMDHKIEFRDLIDFGHPQESLYGETNLQKIEPEEDEDFSRRKKSFTLYEENESDEKLQLTLEKVRKGTND